MDKMNNKFVVYTALFGNYDDLIEPKEKFQGCDFICFTDQKNLQSSIWEIITVKDIDLPPNMLNRRYKIFPHLFLSEYKQSLYVDANIRIIKNPIELAKKYLHHNDIAIPKHFLRNCIYDEALEIIKSKKTDKDTTLNQINFYKKNNFPEKFGLTENNIILRNHNNENIIFLMEKWWEMLNDFTQRDQLSFMYLIWKLNIDIKIIPENARGGKYFRLKLHINSRKKNSPLGKIVNIKNEFILNNPNGMVYKLNSLLSFLKNHYFHYLY